MSGPQLTVPACSQSPLGQCCCCCKRCNLGGCDLKVLDCGCCFHTRCYPATEPSSLTACPLCHSSSRSVLLLPMTFAEIDQAQAEAANTAISDKRGKKRKNATISRLDPSQTEACDLRTGRWTNEETAYCDKLIYFFEQGSLPIPDGIKLNDFLSNMLKSKQSRLTKKMKNARLSARQYKKVKGYIESDEQARELSIIETEFFASIRCNMERSEIRFHMQKEWRELFSSFCVSIGRTLDGSDWLQSVEELDRRASTQKDAARMSRRKEMMGYALRHDSNNLEDGVFIDPTVTDNARQLPSYEQDTSDSEQSRTKKRPKHGARRTRPARHFSSAFIGQVIDFIQRNQLPFEHVDVWVPSFISSPDEQQADGHNCRLCFAGCGTTDIYVPTPGEPPVRLNSEEQFDLLSFGEYSQKFSFDIGSGLPGRVYSSGIPSWEQGIQNAPVGQFERKGGAEQWGIQTVLGVPVPSPNVGRISVLFYSRLDRVKDEEMVSRISAELARLMPFPKWKLVVDVGVPSSGSDASDSQFDARVYELMSLVQKYMPESKTAPLALLLPGFASLRVLLLKNSRTNREKQLLESAVESFRVHKLTCQSEAEVVCCTARDFMNMTRSHASVTDYKKAPAPTAAVDSVTVAQAEQSQQQLFDVSQTAPLNQQAVLQNAFHLAQLEARLNSNASTSYGRAHVEQGNGDVSIDEHENSSTVNPQNQFGALDIALASPSLHGLLGHPDNIPPLNNSQISALLQHDATHYQGI